MRLVHVSRGKQARAEPVAALYESGRMHHVGRLIGLEDEMVTWVPLESTDSPNRVDALVWATTELLIDATGGGGLAIDLKSDTCMIAFGAVERLFSRRSREDAIRVLKTLAAAKRAPLMAHEILATEAVLYDEKLGYDGPVFDLVTVIRSKTPDEWARRAHARGREGHVIRIWREVAEAWVRALKRKDSDA